MNDLTKTEDKDKTFRVVVASAVSAWASAILTLITIGTFTHSHAVAMAAAWTLCSPLIVLCAFLVVCLIVGLVGGLWDWALNGPTERRGRTIDHEGY